MAVLVTCKNTEDPFKNEFLPAIMNKIQCQMKALEWSQYYQFFRRSRAASQWLYVAFKLFIVLLVIGKNEEIIQK